MAHFRWKVDAMMILWLLSVLFVGTLGQCVNPTVCAHGTCTTDTDPVTGDVTETCTCDTGYAGTFCEYVTNVVNTTDPTNGGTDAPELTDGNSNSCATIVAGDPAIEIFVDLSTVTSVTLTAATGSDFSALDMATLTLQTVYDGAVTSVPYTWVVENPETLVLYFTEQTADTVQLTFTADPTFDICEVQVQGADVNEVATGMNVASSDAPESGPSDLTTGGCVELTGDDPWVRIDLLRVHMIQSLLIGNDDGTSTGESTLEIFIGDETDEATMTLVDTIDLSTLSPQMFSFVPSVSGRYVLIKASGNGVTLKLCDFLVFGYPVLENVAPDGSVLMSSATDENVNGPDNMNDDDESTCAYTMLEDEPWILVDLGTPRDMIGLRISSLQDLSDIEVSAGLDMNSLADLTATNTVGVEFLFSGLPFSVRYVLIRPADDNDREQLQICEVEVYTESLTRCNGNIYDPLTETCCDGSIQPSFGGTTECCGSISYNSGCYDCAIGTIVPRYDPDTQMCCGDTYGNMDYERSCCCDSTIINADEEICCYGIARARVLADPYCCECTNDIERVGIYVDLSENLQSIQLTQLRSFLTDFVMDINIDSGNVDLAFAGFNTVTDHDFVFGDLSTTSEVLNHLNNMVVLGSGTNIGAAISHWSNALDARRKRSHAQSAMIIFVDSESPDKITNFALADEIKSLQGRIIVVAIGPYVDDIEVQYIASDPDSENLFYVDTYDELPSIMQQLHDNLFPPCEASCGGLPYDSATQICCNDVIQPLFGDNTECCDTVSYDANCASCVGGVVGLDYDPLVEICCQGNITPITTLACCCGDTAFDATTQTCCNGVVEPRPVWDTTNCCHCRSRRIDIALLVDTSQSVVDEMIVSIVKEIIDQAYTDETNFALTYFHDSVNDVFALGEFPDKQAMFNIIDITAITHGGSNAGLALNHVENSVLSVNNRLDASDILVIISDGDTDSPDTFIAEADALKSTGVQIIAIAIGLSPNTTLLSQVVSSPSEDNIFTALTINSLVSLPTIIDEQFAAPCEATCNGITYNSSALACCFDLYLIPVTDPAATECCGIPYSVNQLYDPTVATCCHYQVVEYDPLYPERTECCGSSSLYDPNEEICCNSIRQPMQGNSLDVTECCGGRSFDNRCDICSNYGTVVPVYDATQMICCNGTIFAKNDGGACCCGSMVINAENEICDNGVARPRTDNDNQICCHTFDNKFDVVLIVDVSSSASQPGKLDMVDFIAQVINNVNTDSVNFALITYHTSATVLFQLTSDKTQMLNNIQSLPLFSGTRNLGDALLTVQTQDIFTTFDRVDAPNMAIVITDGYSTDNIATQSMAEVLRLIGIEVMAIGIGLPDPMELLQIASSPDNVLLVNDFSSLTSLVDDIAARFGECTEYPDWVQCGNVPYNPSVSVCCNDNVVPITNIGETECCGMNQLYNPLTAVCCGVNVVQKPSADKTTCCFDIAVYNNQTEQCCGGAVIGINEECCGSLGYSSTGCQICVNGVLTSNYNHNTHICCGDVLHVKPYSQTCCCGTSAFDASSYTCCNNQIVPRDVSDTSNCCHCINKQLDIALVVDVSESVVQAQGHALLMNFISQIISDADDGTGNVRFALITFHSTVKLEFNLNEMTELEMLTYIQSIPIHNGGTSTGVALQLLQSDVFGSGNVNDRPGVPNIAIVITDGYSFDNALTVQQAELAQQSGIEMIAVGIGVPDSTELYQIASEPSNVYQSNDFNTLYSIVSDIEAEFIGACTVYCGNIPYNPSTSVCCSGYLVPITTPGEIECCGINKLYNPSTAVCCGINVLPIVNQGSTTCCFDTTLYNNNTEQCCGGTVISLQQECCGNIGYYTTGCQTCVNGVLVSNYDKQTHICCGDVLHVKTFGLSCCCGTSVFDSSSHTCCNNQIIPRDLSDTSTCCHCINKQMDIALVVDVSESVVQAQGHDLLMNFISQIISDADDGTGNVRFALITFHSTVKLEFNLNQMTKAQMLAYIQSIPIYNGGTSTGVALQLLQTDVFSIANVNDRPGVPNIAIVITDGYSFNNALTVQQADLAHAQGIEMIAVGIGVTDSTELFQIASEPSNVYQSQSFNTLYSIVDDVETEFIGECTVYCGNIPYNPYTSVCCSGNVVPITTPGEIECCGINKLYDPSTAVCCGVNVLPIVNQGSTTCCFDTTLYNNNTEQCCGGTVISLQQECCGNIGYYTTGCQTCVNGVLVSNYDKHTHICCGDVLHVKTFGLSCCCGTSVFDSSSHTCCNNQIIPRALSDTSTCCHCINKQMDIALVVDVSESVVQAQGHDLLMNFISQIISDADDGTGNVRFALITFHSTVKLEFNLNQMTKAEMLAYIQSIPIYNGGTSTGVALQLLQTDVFSIANVNDRPGVPNIAIVITDGYSFNNALTVQQADLAHAQGIEMIAVGIGVSDSTELFQIASEPSNVYQSQSFDTLYSIVDDVRAEFIGECTVYCGNTPYNPYTSVCCSGNVVLITTPGETECCGINKVYNPSTAVCCGDNVLPIVNQGSTACCFDTTLYNNNTEQCCGGTVISLQQECCGNVGYYTTGCQTCVNGVLVSNYDKHTHICCGDVLHVKTFGLSCCCGTSVFDSSSHTCCNNQIIPRALSDTSTCCHCINNQLDIALVVDVSESVVQAQGHDLLMNFISQIISDADDGTGNVRFALITFHSTVKLEFNLNQMTKAEMLAYIQSIPIYNGGTSTGVALQLLQTDVFGFGNVNDRPGVPNIAIVITDGYSFNNALTVQQADLAHAQGIEMIAVGIGVSDSTELFQIASEPSNVYQSESFNTLYSIVDDVRAEFIGECTEFPDAVYCGNTPYNPYTSICCSGNVVPIMTPGETECCGINKVYNPSTAVCCGANVLPIVNQGSTTCCFDTTLYNNNTEQCCGGTVISLQQECCGNVGYYTTGCQTCVNGVLVSNYDKHTHICCGDVLHVKTFGLSCCCGTSVFDSSSHTCCNNHIIPRALSDTSTCCHCINNQLDIALVVDVSESVVQAQGHDLLMNFISQIISDADDGSGNVRFALITFHSTVKLEFNLNQMTKAEMLAYIQSIPIYNGGTSTGVALQLLQTDVFGFGNVNDRPGVPNIAIVITDGYSFDNALTVQQADLAHAQGIEMIAVGIGVTDSTELFQIASEPSNVYQSDSFSTLYSIVDDVRAEFIGECTVYCGNTPYNPATSVCCNGNVVPITTAGEIECCGISKLYNPLTAVCCGINVVPIISADRRTCCYDTVLYNNNTEQCCGGTVISLQQECCGDVGYFVGGCKRCINNELVVSFNQETHICCGDVLHEKYYSHSCCCGSEVFDSSVQCCDNGFLVNKLPFDSSTCCSCINRQLDVALLADISESVYDVSGNYELLMEFLAELIEDADVESGNIRFSLTLYNSFVYNEFNFNTYTNSADMIAHIQQIPARTGGTSTGVAIANLRTNVFTLLAGDRPNVENIAVVLTDGKSFNNTRTVEEAILARQAGIKMLAVGIGLSDAAELNQIASDPTDENVFSVTDFHDLFTLENVIEAKFIGECNVYCGGVEYDPDMYVCCDGSLVAITNSQELTCCGNSALYNAYTAVCCNGNVLPIINPSARDCCDNITLYDAATETCCSGIAIQSGAGDCCNGKHFNPSTEMCCGGNVYDSNCNTCLDGTMFVPYDDTKHICCNGIQLPLENEYTCCCGSQSFNAETSVCCNGQLSARAVNDDSRCCQCLNNKFDIAIVADMSESVTDAQGAGSVKQFISDLIQDFDVDSGAVRIALSMFTHVVYNDFYLDTYNNKASMLQHITTIGDRQGATNTGLAIKNLRDVVFEPAKGDRYDAQNVAVIITDGKSNNNNFTVSQAILARSEGIHLIVVGIGLTDLIESHEIASDPSEDNVFNVEDFDQLFSLESSVKNMFTPQCHAQPKTITNGPKCGGVKFDSDIYICCSGNIEFRHNGQNTKCCGDKSFDSNTFVCCDGTLAPAISGSNTKCCDKLSYDPSAFICCSGKVKPRRESGKTKCCGHTTYDPKTSICCNDEVQPSFGRSSACCQGISYDSRCYSCNNNGKIRAKFDSNKALCCNGKIIDRRFGRHSCCCGRRQINSKTSTCCNGKPREVPAKSPCVCCGDKLYSVTTQTCCDSKRHLKSYGNATQCCGQDIYDSKTHICCEGSIMERRYRGDTQCCGTSPFNSRKEVCCNGNVIRVPDDMSQNEAICCGSALYNSNTQICCQGNVYMKDPEGLSACCGLQAYNPRQKSCGNGVLIDVQYMCGGSQFDQSTQLCCSGNVQPLEFGSFSSCCGDLSYDVREQTCCNGILRNKQTDSKGGCCYGFPFYPKKHLCCNGYRVRKESPTENACCGLLKGYDSQKQICCDGRVQDRVRGKMTQCCGKLSFDPTEKVCCDGIIRPKKFGEVTACCSTQTYNPTHARCCDNKIIRKSTNNEETNEDPSPIQDDSPSDGQNRNDANEDDQDNETITNLKKRVKKLANQLEKNKSDEDKERLERLEKLLSRINDIDDKVRNLKRQIREAEQDSDNERLTKMRKKLKKLREALADIEQSVEDAKFGDAGVRKQRKKLRKILKKFRKIRRKFLQTDEDEEVKQADEEINENNLSETEDAPQLKKRVNRWKRLYKKILRKLKRKAKKSGKSPKKLTKNEKINKLKSKIEAIKIKMTSTDLKASELNELKKKMKNLMNSLMKLTSDMTTQDKIRQKKKMLRQVNDDISNTKNPKKLKDLYERKEQLEKAIKRLKGTLKENEEEENEVIPQVDEEEGKSVEERLRILKKKRRELLSLLKTVSKKSTIREINKRKRIVENRIEKLSAELADNREENDDTSTTTVADNEEEKDETKTTTVAPVEDKKTIQDRIRYLKEKLADIEKSLSDAQSASRKKELRQLKKKVEERLENLKALRDKLKSESGANDNNEEQLEGSDETKTTTAEPVEDEKSIQDRIRYLKEKLADIEKSLSEAQSAAKKKELRQLKKKVEERLENLKALRDKLKSESGANDNNEEQLEGSDETKTTTAEPVEDKKSIQDRIRYLKEKLADIEKSLSDAQSAAKKKELRQLKKKVEERLENLKALRDKLKSESGANDNNEEPLEGSDETKTTTAEPVEDKKTIQDRIRYLREKLADIEKSLSEAQSASKKKELRQFKKQIEERIENLKALRDKLKSEREANDNNEEQLEGSDETKTTTAEPVEDKKTIQDRIRFLREKLADIEKNLKQAQSASKKKELRQLKKQIEERIENLKALRDELKSEREANDNNEQQSEGDGETKTVKERLRNLRQKLREIEEKLSSATKRSVKKELKEMKEKVEARIEKLKTEKQN
ncbi:hypothetical protein ACF0H5_015127 [Mactra antiquata]